MGKVYIVCLASYEYNDEYFYRVDGCYEPNHFFTKKSEAEKYLLDLYKGTLLDADGLPSYFNYDEHVCIDEALEFQHELRLIGSKIEIPSKITLDHADPFDWIPEDITDAEVKIFMKYFPLYVGKVQELTKHG